MHHSALWQVSHSFVAPRPPSPVHCEPEGHQRAQADTLKRHQAETAAALDALLLAVLERVFRGEL
jgi:hypothetical protein